MFTSLASGFVLKILYDLGYLFRFQRMVAWVSFHSRVIISIEAYIVN
jgi:hypothetical protein